MIQQDILSILEDKIQTVTHLGRTNILAGPIQLPVNLGGETVVFQWYCWMPATDAAALTQQKPDSASLVQQLSSLDLAEKQQSSVLVYGDFANSDEAVIRMHSICHTGDIFGSKRCDCGFQLEQSMKMIAAKGSGALFYLANHEGRGIGLFSKAMAYLLQEKGYDTVEANLELGFSDDVRNYDDAIGILKSLRRRPVTVITNNPKKLEALKGSGMNIAGRIPLWGDVSPFNEKYLRTKITRSGHLGQKKDRPNESA